MIRFRSSNLNFFINEYRLYSDSSRRLVSSTALKTVTSTKSKPSADSRKPKSPFPPTYSEYSPATYNTEDSEFKNLKTDDIFGESEFMYRRSGYGSDVAAQGIDWMTSFEGIGCESVSDQAKKILMAPVNEDDIEIKPGECDFCWDQLFNHLPFSTIDGLIYLPEIKYRRILNQAFGPGGWGIVPRSPHSIIGRTLTREYALVVGSRLVSQSRGEQEFFSDDGLPTATEGMSIILCINLNIKA